MELGRRAFVGGALSLWPLAALAASKHYRLREIQVTGDRRLGQRFALLTPAKSSGQVPLLVALHGLGETGDQRTGARAWIDRYGLGGAYDRLCRPPLVPLVKGHRHWAPKRLAELNATLAKQPFRGLAVACPYTPNVYQMARHQALDDYADWLVDVVVPKARREANVYPDAAHTSLDGCSLGGYVGLEVFLRKPTHFGAWGSVQGAFGAHRVDAYAKAVAAIVATGKQRIHLETSGGDAFRKVNEQLSKALAKHQVAHDFVIPPGPHDQPFLRDSGTIEMLLWHDRLPR